MPTTPQEIEEVIANGRRLVEEARKAVAKSEKFFADRGIDPKNALEELRAQCGDEAVAIVQAQVQEALRGIEEDVRRARLHTPKARPAGKRARVRPNMI